MSLQYHSLRNSILEILDRLSLLILARAIYNKLFRYWLNIPLHIRNSRFQQQGAPDGLAIPAPELTFLVGGSYDLEAFYNNGKQGAECIRSILSNNGLSIEGFKSILDFGCGCGRVIRHWHPLKGSALHGSDYNPLPISWLKSAYPFAEFRVNGLMPPLPYQKDQFDFIYTISVFTHLDEALQYAWINELHHVMKPGGYCYMTLLGTAHIHALTDNEREQFHRGELVVRRSRHPGTNLCLAYHPEQYVRNHFAKNFSVIDFVPGGAKDAASQDVFLLRKK